MEFRIRTKMWPHQSERGTWYLVRISKKTSQQIRFYNPHSKRGWGSVPVVARVGATTWKTSIFWEKEGTYVMLIKAAVRKAEGLAVNKQLNMVLQIEGI